MISVSENSAYVTQRLKCNQYLEAMKVDGHHLSFVRIPTASRQRNKPAAISPYSFEHNILTLAIVLKIFWQSCPVLGGKVDGPN